jgi:hypothetical protein
MGWFGLLLGGCSASNQQQDKRSRYSDCAGNAPLVGPPGAPIICA